MGHNKANSPFCCLPCRERGGKRSFPQLKYMGLAECVVLGRQVTKGLVVRQRSYKCACARRLLSLSQKGELGFLEAAE